MRQIKVDWWFLVYVSNARTGDEWYEMMSNITLEDQFESRGDYFQCRSNSNVTLQIQSRSRDITAVAQALLDARSTE